MKNYHEASLASQEFNERNDCAVRAVAVATGVDYATVHKLFKKHGRRNGRGTPPSMTWAVVIELGFKLVDVTRKVPARTVRKASPYLHDGSYLVSVRGHLLCVKDGKVEDWTAGRLHRIRRIQLVVRTEEAVPAQPVAEVKAPRNSSLKQSIWQHADRVWSEAGQPTGKGLRKLRIQMMDELEGHGFKRTTLSTELGKWQKARIAK